MGSDFNFTVTYWFLGNVRVKPYFNTQWGGGCKHYFNHLIIIIISKSSFKQKELWEFDHFWPIFQKKIPRNHQFFSKSSRFHALCSKIFRKSTFFEWVKWVNGLGFFSSKWTGLEFLKKKNYRSDFGRKSSEKTEMIVWNLKI